MSTPENVRLREDAGARCPPKIKWKVVKKRARKARAEHLVKSCLEPGKKKAKRKPLTELYLKGHFTEHREEWRKELQRHCEEVYTDQEETKEVQESRIEYFKKKGDLQYTEDGRNAEIAEDLVLQARAKLSDNEVNGPEDAIVSEMIKTLPLEKIYAIAKYFQEPFMGLMESPSSWKIVKLVFLGKPDAAPKKGIRSYRAIAPTSVMSKWYASCIILRLEREREPENWKNLHVGGMDGISCHHFQVMVTNLLQKHWEWQEERNPVLRHGTVVRPTMFLARLDIKTAFDEAKPPKHVAQILEYHNTHGWLIAGLLSEMSVLEGKGMFECVESCFRFNRCLPQGSVEAPRLWQKMVILANVEEEWMRKRSGILVDLEGEGVHQRCSFMWADNFWIMSHSEENLKHMLRDLIAEANRWDLVPKLASLWWTSTYDSEEKSDMNLGTSTGCCKFPFEDKFKILGCAVNRQRKTHDAIEERMQWANKAFGKDILMYTSRDVPWKVKCQRLVDHVYAVFAFGSEKLVVAHTDDGKYQRMGNQDNDTPVPFQKT